MAHPGYSSPSVQSGPLQNQMKVLEIMKHVEVLLEENKVLDKKENFMKKKRMENLEKISRLVGKVKRMEEENIDVMNVQEDGDESQEEEIFVNLREEEIRLVQKIEESTRNLIEHEELLKDLEVESGGQGANWQEQFDKVVQYREVNEKYKDSKKKRLKAIRRELRTGSQSETATSRRSHGKGKVLEEKLLVQGAGINSSARPSSSTSSFASKRILNESVVDCEFILKKVIRLEKEVMVPTVIKVEEESPPNPFGCNFCPQSFTSAAPLVIHLEKHTTEAQEKVDCPFRHCSFAGYKENLTKHVRAKHTKEQLFPCCSCPTKFHTMAAKTAHEKKHSQPNIWAQCGKAACHRFYQVEKGGCKCGKK
eukprot:GFUD01026770.1.p1 GENE.GFUD01026770.1~~GFUD01026770.1.p1  ORF type:complete len:366 (-),score=119.09 GFUD01026770.1:79-1176(-)